NIFGHRWMLAGKTDYTVKQGLNPAKYEASVPILHRFCAACVYATYVCVTYGCCDAAAWLPRACHRSAVRPARRFASGAPLQLA
ncbi:MAG: hypothetical protein RXR52_22725, partial [Paraburkholderia sp.]|uniref:hypothetical protein n=1 Tax=Paraburkholderia sp. TaxID=1926495 RepID=UPI00397C0577